MPAVGYRRPPGHTVFPAAPLAVWVTQRRAGLPIKGPNGLAMQCRVAESTMRRLLNGRAQVVRIGTVDQITMSLGGRIDDVYDSEPTSQHALTNGHKQGPADA